MRFIALTLFFTLNIFCNVNTSHKGALHNPLYVCHLGETVELEDGSIWDIEPKDHKRTRSWMTHDLVFIGQNDEWFTNYNFFLYNVNTHQKAHCKLKLPPYFGR